jgi:hypothetical protein
VHFSIEDLFKSLLEDTFFRRLVLRQDMPTPGLQITADNRGPWVNIIVWILLVVMCLATFVKIFVKWTMAKRFDLDDLFMLLGMVSSLTLLLSELYLWFSADHHHRL